MLIKNLLVISRYWHWFSRRLPEGSHLSGPDLMILSFLENRGLLNQDCLCKFLLLDKASMAKAAARLEEHGYIHRAVNDKDKREKLLGLTDAGRAVCSALEETKRRWEAICFNDFTDEELALFDRLSERAARNAVEYRKKKEAL